LQKIFLHRFFAGGNAKAKAFAYRSDAKQIPFGKENAGRAEATTKTEASAAT
jgi:hypothetical protein